MEPETRQLSWTPAGPSRTQLESSWTAPPPVPQSSRKWTDFRLGNDDACLAPQAQFLRKTVQRKTASRLATQNSWLSDAMSRSCSVFLFFASRLVALPRVLHQTWSGARSEQPSSAGLAGDHPPRPIIPITDGCCRGRQYTAAPVGTLEPRGVSRTAPCARWGVALSPRTPGSARQCRCPGPRSRSSSVPSRR